MHLIKVEEGRMDMLTKFQEESMFTFEGIDISDKLNIKKLEKAAREAGYKDKDMIAYWFKGDVMNKAYGLTGSNAYPDSLTFLVIPNLQNPMFKLACGARWFDDIVANNSIRQNAINCGYKPDYK